ncbi:hypothetical protein LSH36_633g00002, partial [Paralvinella palmiformis]
MIIQRHVILPCNRMDRELGTLLANRGSRNKQHYVLMELPLQLSTQVAINYFGIIPSSTPSKQLILFRLIKLIFQRSTKEKKKTINRERLTIYIYIYIY